MTLIITIAFQSNKYHSGLWTKRPESRTNQCHKEREKKEKEKREKEKERRKKEPKKE